MFAIAFDLVVADTEAHHPKGISQAYADIRALQRYGFRNIQGSVYVSENAFIANLMLAMNALKALPWFSVSVRDVRAFRVDYAQDRCPLMRGENCA
jgi:virulence-associated protein VapD